MFVIQVKLKGWDFSAAVEINYEVFIFKIAKKLTILNKAGLYNDDIIKINFVITFELYKYFLDDLAKSNLIGVEC